MRHLLKARCSRHEPDRALIAAQWHDFVQRHRRALVRHYPGSDGGGELLAPLVLIWRRNRTSAASLGGSSDYCGVWQGRPDIVAVGCMLVNQPRSATAALIQSPREPYARIRSRALRACFG